MSKRLGIIFFGQGDLSVPASRAKPGDGGPIWNIANIVRALEEVENGLVLVVLRDGILLRLPAFCQSTLNVSQR